MTPLKNLTRLTLFFGLTLVAVLFGSASFASPPDPPFTDVQLTRALGMGIMFEVRLGQGAATSLSDNYTAALGDLIQNAGFTAVSIRIDMKMFQASSGGAPNYTLSPEFMRDLQFVVDDILRRGMIALIAPKGLEDGTQLSTALQVAWWGQIAGHFKNYSHRLLFRLLNEPLIANFPNGLGDIQPLYQALVNAVRPANPTRYVVIFAQRASEIGPGATDFNVMPLPTNASPYLLDFHALGGNPTSDELSKLIGRVKQAWQFREATWVPVWSGAWEIGSWTQGWDLDLTRRLANEFGRRQCSIPGIYLMFNGGDTSIYDVAQDRNGNGLTNEWTQPALPPLLTDNGPYDWTPSYHAIADAQVNSNNPDANFGADNQLRCDGVRFPFLQFNVTNIPTNATIAAVTLKVFCTSAAGDTIEVHRTGANWAEDSLTWNNRPNVRTNILDSIAVTQTNTWYAFDVASTISTNGVYSYALLRSTSLGSTIFQARDPNLDPADPQLIVTVSVPSSNHPPMLPPIANCTLNPGQTLSLTNAPTDPDTPAQFLVCSFFQNPVGATLDPASGVLAWRPSTAQADTTNLFTVMVADNGSPTLSATQTFSVVVKPLTPVTISKLVPASEHFRLTLAGPAGPDYTIQASTNFTHWTNLFTTNSPMPPFTWSDPSATNLPHRFYRALIGP